MSVIVVPSLRSFHADLLCFTYTILLVHTYYVKVSVKVRIKVSLVVV